MSVLEKGLRSMGYDFVLSMIPVFRLVHFSQCAKTTVVRYLAQG